VDQSLIHPVLEGNMTKARQVVEKVHSQRKASGLKLRQPLAKLTISGKPFGKPNLHQVILAETNISKLEFTAKGKELTVKLDTQLTPELKQAGQARELVRQIQQARKEAGTKLDEVVKLELPSWPEKFTDYIQQKTLVKTITKGKKLKIIRG
jgi:isoleucyl-tRNA synthetase